MAIEFIMKVTIFNFSLFGINTYVVSDSDTKECVIIDPAMIDEVERHALVDFIDREGLEVTGVINTHLHIDHCIGNEYVVSRYGTPVSASRADEFLGKSLPAQAEEFGLPFQPKDIVINQPLEDGDEIKVGNGLLKVMHLPGHSPGGIGLYDKADGFLIAGDSIFQRSIGRTDLPGGDYGQLIGVLKEKVLPLPDSTVIYPGHGPATTVGEEKKYNPFLR